MKNYYSNLLIEVNNKYKDYLDLPYNFTFGTEIEFDNLSIGDAKKAIENKSINSWNIEVDWSVTKNDIGGELVSEKLRNKKQDYKKLKKACQILKKNRATANESTAAHIHIGAHIFGKDVVYFKRLLKMWITFENVIYRYARCESETIREKYSLYSLPLSKEFKFYIDNIDTQTDLVKFIDKQNEVNEKFCINLLNLDIFTGIKTEEYNSEEIYTTEGLIELLENNCEDIEKFENKESYMNTIEFTVFNGTLNEKIWQENINFIGQLCNYVMSDNYNDELIDYMYNLVDNNHFKNYSEGDSYILSELIYSNNTDKEVFLNRCNKDANVKQMQTLTKTI